VANGQPSLDGYCLPTCNDDVECPGRRCHPSSGVCVDAVNGDPTGAACSPAGSANVGSDANGNDRTDTRTDASGDDAIDGSTNGNSARGSDIDTDATTGNNVDGAVITAVGSSGCAGVCLAVGSSTHICAQRCTYGSPTACHLAARRMDGGAGEYSACIFIPSNGSAGVGDEAHCGQLCDTSADCLDQVDPGVFCNRSNVALKTFGHGYCDWSPPVVDAGVGDR